MGSYRTFPGCIVAASRHLPIAYHFPTAGIYTPRDIELAKSFFHEFALAFKAGAFMFHYDEAV